MVHINFEFPEDLHKLAKSRASLKGLKLKDYIINCVEADLGDYDRNL